MTNETNKEAIIQANSEIYQSFETLNFTTAARHLTADCDYITFNGMHIQGRDAYIQVHEQMMHNHLFRGATAYAFD